MEARAVRTGQEREGEIDIGQEDQKQYYQKQQEMEEQMSRDREDENAGLQIADPRDHEEDGVVEDGENVGAQVYAPGKGEWGFC